MYEKQIIGKFGENITCKYLKINDYLIIDTISCYVDL